MSITMKKIFDRSLTSTFIQLYHFWFCANLSGKRRLKQRSIAVMNFAPQFIRIDTYSYLRRLFNLWYFFLGNRSCGIAFSRILSYVFEYYFFIQAGRLGLQGDHVFCILLFVIFELPVLLFSSAVRTSHYIIKLEM